MVGSSADADVLAVDQAIDPVRADLVASRSTCDHVSLAIDCPDPVGPTSAAYEVAAGPRKDGVVADTGVDDVVSARRRDRVVPFTRADAVARPRSAEAFAPAGPLDGAGDNELCDVE